MTEKSRIRYDRNRREKITVLPAGMAATLGYPAAENGELIPEVCREIESVRPAGEIQIEAICDRGCFCPLCGKRVELEGRTAVEFRGKCTTCKKFLIAMFYSGSTAVVTVKRYHPR